MAPPQPYERTFQQSVEENRREDMTLYRTPVLNNDLVKPHNFTDLGTEENKVRDGIKYFFSENYLNRPTDKRVLKKVRFSLGNQRLQSLYAPSNQFEFPTKKERLEWEVLQPRKRNLIEEDSHLGPSFLPKWKKRRKKRDEDEDFMPEFGEEDSSEVEQNDDMENHDLNELLGKDRRVNIEFNDSNMGFSLQPVEGRFKAMVAHVRKDLMESEKLYPGMRVCSIENQPIPRSCSFDEIWAMIKNLRFPALIEFVDVYKNRCKICLRAFLKYEELILHMVQHTQQQEQASQVDQMEQRKRWLMNLQYLYPVMYQQYVIQHQIGRLQEHMQALRLDPTLHSQLQQAGAYMETLKNQLILLNRQQQAEMLQKQKSSSFRGDINSLSQQGVNEAQNWEDVMRASYSSNLNAQVANSQMTAAAPSTEHLQNAGHELPIPGPGPRETTQENVNTQPPTLDPLLEENNIKIALAQLATLKKIYDRSPQTAVAQVAGLLQMAEKNEVAVGQLKNLQKAAKTDAELSDLFARLQATAFAVLQQHLDRQSMQKDSPQQHSPTQLNALDENVQKSEDTFNEKGSS